MRLLHTSDWHLGRLFHGASLLAEQQAALSRIVDLVADRGIHVVVVAGDLYDRSVPPADAVELFDRTLADLHHAGATVVAISGNHDSAVRVGFGDRLLSAVGVTVRGDVTRAGEPVVVPADDGGPPVAIHPIPYLDPPTVSHHAESGARRFSHHDAMAWATARARADLASRAGALRSVVVAHTFITGGNPSESERELTLGQLEQVRLDAFDGFDYVALGHLHQGQEFAAGRVAYSGSPLRYSFSEEHHRKGVRVVELAPDGSIQVERVELGVGRPLRTLTGTLDSLLDDPALTDAQDAWVRARLTDRELPLQAMARLQRRFPHAVELRHEPHDAAPDDGVRLTTEQVRRSDPVDLASRFLESQRGLATSDAERTVLTESIDAVRAGDTHAAAPFTEPPLTEPCVAAEAS